MSNKIFATVPAILGALTAAGHTIGPVEMEAVTELARLVQAYPASEQCVVLAKDGEDYVLRFSLSGITEDDLNKFVILESKLDHEVSVLSTPFGDEYALSRRHLPPVQVDEAVASCQAAATDAAAAAAAAAASTAGFSAMIAQSQNLIQSMATSLAASDATKLAAIDAIKVESTAAVAAAVETAARHAQAAQEALARCDLMSKAMAAARAAEVICAPASAGYSTTKKVALGGLAVGVAAAGYFAWKRFGATA